MSATADLPVLQNTSLRFGEQQILQHVNLSLKPGSINCLLGASGCGKSTLLRVVAGLLQADSGCVLVRPEQCALVFQDPRLLRWLTVAENLELALAHQPRTVCAERIRHILDVVHLQGTQNLLPHELSGGMAQRVGIARALLRSPSLLLMDEPFAALDAITRRKLQQALCELIAQQHTTCLFVTHDVDEALALGQRLFVMQSGRIARQWDIPQDRPWDETSTKQQIVQALHGPQPFVPASTLTPTFSVEPVLPTS